MVFDDIIIGSGLTALATAYGLPNRRRVLVLTGGSRDTLAYYDARSNIPCFNLGFGGLGNFWHGVIPLPPADSANQAARSAFAEVFRIFYPEEPLPESLVGSWLYVPYRPIRPKPHWRRLADARAGHLSLVHLQARSITADRRQWLVHTTEGSFEGHRLWLAAGALGTPALLERSPMLAGTAQKTASDHAIVYLGQIDRREYPHIAGPAVRRGTSGIWMQALDRLGAAGLVTVKPARFAYRRLDHGIRQRSAFGLPAAGLVKKVLRAGSLGLLAESLFSKFGLFPNAEMLSVYAQIRVAHGYRRMPGREGIQADEDVIAASILNARQHLHLPEMRTSRQPEMYVHGIHLHGTVSPVALAVASVAGASSIEVVDASAAQDIGNQHHSFRLMTNAYHKARHTTQSL
jgi:hypothetical protein